jgi:hypothetical protein
VTHKIITIWIGSGKDAKGRRHAPIPYASTTVGFNRSVGEIKDLLKRFKCTTIADFQQRGPDNLTLNTLGFEKDGLRYLIEFPIVYVENSQGKRLNMDVSGRIVFNRVKALLVDAEIEYLSFHEAMLPYLALPTPHGTMSVMEAVQSNIENIKAGTSGLFLLPGGNR